MATYNKNNAGVKRIMAEARELERDGSTEYTAKPTEEDLFDWHCTIRGPPDSEFEGGLYHARIVLPPEYPFKAPSIMLLTPNGRFELNKKICISFTSYHEDLWQPSWGVRTAIIGLQSFFPVKGEGAMGVGGIEVPIPERKRLAALSRDWVCPHCNQSNLDLLPDAPHAESTSTTSAEAASSPESPSPISPEAAETVSPSSVETPAAIEADTPLSDPIPVPLPATADASLSAAILIPNPPPTSTSLQQPPTSITVPPPDVPALNAAASAPVSVVQRPQQASVVVQASTHSRPMDLTPSTPAARVIDEVVPLGHGVHDRQLMMNNMGVHPAVYQSDNDANNGNEDDDDTSMVYVEGQRLSPLWLDLSIGALGTLIAYMFIKRFLH